MDYKLSWLLLFIAVMAPWIRAQDTNITAPSINGVLYVDGMKYKGNEDIGATLNQMMRDLPRINGYPSGKIVIPCGYYPLKTRVDWNGPYVSVEGSGSACTVINSSFNGDAFLITTKPFTVLQSGGLRYLTINGNNLRLDHSVGVHLQDVTAFDMYDVVITKFNGSNSAGLWMDNVTHFTERTVLTKVHLDLNTKDWRFTNSGGGLSQASFGYTKALDVGMNVDRDQIGISFEGGLLYNCILNLNANVSAGTGTVLRLSGVQFKDGPGSYIYQCFGDFAAEATDVSSGIFIDAEPGTHFQFSGLLASDGLLRNAGAGEIDNPITAMSGAVPFAKYVSPEGIPGKRYNIALENPAADRTLTIQDPGRDDALVFVNADQALSRKRFVGSIPVGDTAHGIGAALLGDTGLSGKSLEGLGINFNWNGTNYELFGDGANNGGQAVLGSTEASDIQFYVIPSGGQSKKTVSPSELSRYLVGTIDADGNASFRGDVKIKTIHTESNCISSSSPALCGSAAAGNFVLPSGSSSVVVETTAVTTSSEISIVFDPSLSSSLSVTCSTAVQQPYVIARDPGGSFTVSVPTKFLNQAGCFSFQIVN